MNILQIISSSGMYGAESVLLNLSRALNREGTHKSVVGVFANSSNPNFQLYERAALEGIDSYLIPCTGQFDRGVISRIRELVEQTGADIVHSHGFKADVYAYRALANCNCSLVATCHNWIDENARVYLYGVIDRYVLRSFDRVVAVSDAIKRRLLKAGVADERIAVVGNGIDLQRFRFLPARRDTTKSPSTVVGFVGRLSREKGVDIFLRAASYVVVQYPEVEFTVVGEGPDRDEIERLIDELKIKSRVFLMGRQDDMPSVYRSFDVMVSSSRKEAFPVAILEGMAAGLPVVATAVGEVPRFILNGETGLLLPTNDPRAVAEAIMKLLVDCESRSRIGCAARRLVEREYSAEKMAGEYVRLYEEAAAIRARRAQEKANQRRGAVE
jgi:glycosyltransferase involved in cell wall biosynthesis